MAVPEKKWLVQDAALVRFRDDPALLHWRMVLISHEGDSVTVVTPDRDVEDTALSPGDIYLDVRRMDGGRLPRGVRERDTYLPKHSPEGEFSPDEIRRLVLLAERNRQGTHERKRIVGRADEPKPAGPPPVVSLAQQKICLVVFRSGSGELGEEVTPPGDSVRHVINGKTFVLFGLGGEEILAREISPDEVESVQRSLRVQGGADLASEKDVRVLPVLFDSADERWRTIPEAVPEMEEVTFDDFPLQGPRTIMHDVRQLRRLSMDFTQHHESWLKKSGVRHTDRSVHEHAAICRALNLLVCYDQLNAGGLACAEAMNRRRTLIEHAHQGRPDTPSYEGADDFLGVRDSADGSLIDPALQQHAARRQAAKAEVLKQTRLAAEERKHLRDGGNGKGDGKAKGGRGEKAPDKP